MKIDDLFKTTETVLEEGLSSVLYHGTMIRNVVGILQSDKLLTKNSVRPDEAKFNRTDKLYYASFARSKWSWFLSHPLVDEDIYVIMTIDGRRLGSTYKGMAVDYFHVHNAIAKVSDYGGMYNKKDEMEDRVYTDKPFIQNFSKYIDTIEVYVYSPSSRELKTAYFDLLKKLFFLSKQKGIPIKFYRTTTNIRTGANEVSFTSLLTDVKRLDRQRAPIHSLSIKPAMDMSSRRVLVAALKLLKGIKVDPTDKRELVELRFNELENIFYMMRNVTRETLHTSVIQEMRRRNMRTTRELFIFIQNELEQMRTAS